MQPDSDVILAFGGRRSAWILIPDRRGDPIRVPTNRPGNIWHECALIVDRYPPRE
jgi:hypothetical protein